jgi:MoaA/NifB/PqqE/SkfB family radical SAM enzyme
MATAGVTLDMVTTNGVNLHQKADLLLRCKLSEMMISLNYSSEDHYAKFMRTAGAKFHKVVENIRLMDQKLREQNRRKETWLATQFFLHRSTVEGLIAMAELGATLPVDILTIKAIGGIPDEEVILPSQYDRILELLPAVVDKLRGRLTFHIDLDVLGLQQQANALMADHRRTSVEEVAPLHAIEYCYIGWYSMTIQGNGDVHACCYLMNDDRIAPLGNLNHQSVQEVWRGPGYQKFRQEMRTAMLFSEKTPFQQRRFKCTQPACWEHDQCPLSYLMATPDFYRRAHEHLETLRKKPGQALIIAANSLSRKVIESVKKATPLR